MHCIERRAPGVKLALWMGLAGLGVLGGCSNTSPSAPAATATAPTPSTPRTTASGGSPAPVPAAPGAVALPPPHTVRNWNEVRLQAAKRLVAANPQMTYMGEVPEPLLAIPVLVVELNGDGSIRKIDVMRHPSQARDTTQIAMEAVRNAAPFGDVSRLPKPWRFTETFLFDDDRRFKPRTLD